LDLATIAATRRRCTVKLTAMLEIMPYEWVHPDEER
jgi:hypothetical protein